MQIVDVIILLMLGLGAAVGFARGFFKQTVQSLGGILVIILAFIFTGPLAMVLVDILPAFNLKGIFDGISSLNVLIYEVIAFVILIAIFTIIFRIVLAITMVVEKILKATVILAIPSKILGAIMGLLEAYIIVFIILFILTLPVFNIGLIDKSEYKDKILEGTPLVSELAKKTVKSFKDVYALRDQLSEDADRLQLDHKVLKILIDNNVISDEKAAELFEKGKLNTR